MSIRLMIVAATLPWFLSVTSLAQQNPPSPRGTFATDATDTQALGSIAHQQQKSSTSPSKRHVITDEDMPSHPSPASPDLKTRAPSGTAKTEAITNIKKAAPEDEDLLSSIKGEKQRVHEMETELALLEAQLESWRGDDCRKYYSNSGLYYDACPEVTKLVADRDRAKKNLETQQATLEDLQEKARKAGFTSRQYDPD